MQIGRQSCCTALLDALGYCGTNRMLIAVSIVVKLGLPTGYLLNIHIVLYKYYYVLPRVGNLRQVVIFICIYELVTLKRCTQLMMMTLTLEKLAF